MFNVRTYDKCILSGAHLIDWERIVQQQVDKSTESMIYLYDSLEK